MLWSIGIVLGLVGRLALPASIGYAGTAAPVVAASCEQCACERQCCLDDSDQADPSPLLPITLAGDNCNKLHDSLSTSHRTAQGPLQDERVYRARVLLVVDHGSVAVFLLCCSLLI